MEYVIEMQNITKDFPGIRANDNITLQLKKGEIHALLGENGAGKSTLMSILFGLYQPTKGKIKVRGKDVFIKNPNDANRLGIGMVHQHFKLVHNFTVAENVVLGIEPTQKGLINIDETNNIIRDLSKKYNLYVDPEAKIEDISVGMQQRVEIIKMLYRNNDILIFDEPTAVLTPQEIAELMEIIKQLAAEGKSILLITHKLDEIKEVADTCTVLRKGAHIDTIEVEGTSTEKMAELMVGRPVDFTVHKNDPKVGDVVLDVKDLSLEGEGHKRILSDISFDVRAGEIVTIAGIDGNGQTELVHALSGLISNFSGEITLLGEDVSHFSPRKRTLKGMGHIPEDRHKHGLILDFDMASNMILQTYFEERFQKNGFQKFDAINKYASDVMTKYDVRAGEHEKSIARGLSGGNQQKAIVAREMDREPKLLIAVQPTRGLDVGAIEYIHGELIKSRDKGMAILLVSLELEEVLNLSDRIYVIFEGQIVKELPGKGADRQEIGLYMAGSTKEEA